jgi:uncharacterized protein with PIN domain
MKVGKKDIMFIAVVLVVVAVAWYKSGPVKTKYVPENDNHKQFYEMVKQKGKAGKKEADIFCPQCHNEKGGVPFPPGHPVKPKDGPMGCHLCHKFK